MRTVVSATALCVSMIGIAAAENPPARGSDDSALLEEVTVTATRRATSLQDTPMSITSLGENDIQHRGLVGSDDYLRSVPSVSLTNNGPGLNNLMIRGVYGEAFDTGPTVGIYMAEMPLTGYALGGSSDVILADIERVEVLRGPQGTLYGSNSLSGTVRYIPRSPDLRTLEGNVEAGYSHTGRYGGDNTTLQGMLNAPLVSDKLAIRVVGYSHQNEGIYRNRAGSDPAHQSGAARFGAQSLAIDKDHVAGSSYTGGRFTALWKPIDQLSFTLTYMKQITAQEDRPYELANIGRYQMAGYQHGGPGAGKDALEIDLGIVNLVGELDLGWGTVMSSTSQIDQEFTRIWDIGSFLTDAFEGELAPITQLSVTDADVFVQEVRLASKLAGPLQFVVGLYYEDSGQPTGQPTYFVGDPALNPFGTQQLWDLFLDRKIKQRAAFGELSYKVTDKVTATVGARTFEYDARDIVTTFNSVVFPDSSDDVESRESRSIFKAGLEFRPADDALLYANWSEGFRLGRPLASELIAQACDLDQDGVLDGTDIPAALDKVSSDTLESYEVGGKLTTLQGRATLSLSAYDNHWTDIPVSVVPPGCLTSTTINGGKARARGVEFEGNFRPMASLQLGLGFGYVNSKLTADTSAGNDGDRMNFTPEITSNLNAEYMFALAGRDAYIRGDYAYYGNYYTGTGERGRKAGGYGVVNLSGGLLWDRIETRLFVTNLLNSDSATSLDGIPVDGFTIRLRPRTVGASLGYRF